jgi:hypothetical protein
MLSIRQQGMVDHTKLQVDADNAFAQEQRDSQLQSFKNTNERAEDTLQKQHDRQQAFLDAANEGLQLQMLKDISEGVPPELLVRRYPQFAPLLGFPATGHALPERQQGLLNRVHDDKSTDATDTDSITVVPQTPPPSPSQAISASSTPQSFYNARIGAWLMFTPLSEKQRQTWSVSYQGAFIVSSLDAESIAEKGYIMPADLIVEINDQPIRSVEVLLNALDASRSGTSLPIRVLRGGQPYDLELDIP